MLRFNLLQAELLGVHNIHLKHVSDASAGLQPMLDIDWRDMDKESPAFSHYRLSCLRVLCFVLFFLFPIVLYNKSSGGRLTVCKRFEDITRCFANSWVSFTIRKRLTSYLLQRTSSAWCEIVSPACLLPVATWQ